MKNAKWYNWLKLILFLSIIGLQSTQMVLKIFKPGADTVKISALFLSAIALYAMLLVYQDGIETIEKMFK